MTAKTILFPTDFSTCSDAGLEYATALARDMDASLLIVHVQEPPAVYGEGESYYGITEPDAMALREMLEKVKPTDPDVPCQRRLITGDVVDAILGLAKSECVDLIVIGTHGRSGLSRLLMGSVAEQIVRQAPCPVLTVKQPPEAKK